VVVVVQANEEAKFCIMKKGRGNKIMLIEILTSAKTFDPGERARNRLRKQNYGKQGATWSLAVQTLTRLPRLGITSTHHRDTRFIDRPNDYLPK
jgi:hypothetical protein